MPDKPQYDINAKYKGFNLNKKKDANNCTGSIA